MNANTILAATLADTGVAPAARGQAWSRVRERAGKAGVSGLPQIPSPAFLMTLRCALLGTEGILVGWSPDSLDDAARTAARVDPSAAMTLLRCAQGSGIEAAHALARTLMADFTASPQTPGTTEAERACARLLLPRAADYIMWTETPLQAFS